MIAAATPKPTFVELFTPKLVTTLREGYGLGGFKADAISGLTVAIVALPLSMAIAIASQVAGTMILTPTLYTMNTVGFVVAARRAWRSPDRPAGAADLGGGVLDRRDHLAFGEKLRQDHGLAAVERHAGDDDPGDVARPVVHSERRGPRPRREGSACGVRQRAGG